MKPVWECLTVLSNDIPHAFDLEPGRVRLNPASYGIRPTAVTRVQQAWRGRIEANPERVLRDEVPAALDRTRHDALSWLGAADRPARFETSVSAAVARAICASRPGPGRGIAITSACYPDVAAWARTIARWHDARVTEVDVPGRPDTDRAAQRLCDAVSRSARIAVVEAVTSPSAQALPLARLVPELRARGVTVIVDGAHVPGQVALPMAEVDPDFCAVGFSKWAFAPIGCALLWARNAGLEDGPPTAGSVDPSAWLTLPTALAFVDALGPARIREHNTTLVEAGVRLLARRLGLDPVVPGADLSMRALRVPWATAADLPRYDALRAELSRREGIEVAFTATGGRLFLRVATQVTTEMRDFERLVRALAARGWGAAVRGGG